MENILAFLASLQLYRATLFIIVPTLIVGVMCFQRWVKLQIRFGRNLRRTVYFFNPENSVNLQPQKDQAIKLGLLKIDNDIKDIRSENTLVLQNLKEKAIYVVGYKKNFGYEKLIAWATDRKIPIIIFAKPGEIEGVHLILFNSYIYCDMVNTSNRLMTTLINILNIIRS